MQLLFVYNQLSIAISFLFLAHYAIWGFETVKEVIYIHYGEKRESRAIFHEKKNFFDGTNTALVLSQNMYEARIKFFFKKMRRNFGF